MTKPTLTALGAALIALGQELQSSEDTGTAPGDTAAPTTRRGRAPKTETPAPESEKEKAAAGNTPEELRELFRPLVEEHGRAVEVKGVLAKLGVAKFSELPAEKYPEFRRSIEALLI